MEPEPRDGPVRRFYLFDNNVFRILCASPGGAALLAFNRSIDAYGLSEEGSSTAFKMTPFTLLEAIGVVPPPISDIVIPPKLAASGSGRDIATYVLEAAAEKYRTCSELRPDTLLERGAAQRRHVTVAASQLYDICVMKPLSTPGFQEHVYRSLAFDYMFKYQYRNNVRDAVRAFQLLLLLAFGEFANESSRFRIVKMLWDEAFPYLRARFPDQSEALARTNKAMRLKSRRDFVDCELLHYLLYGYDHLGTVVPVAGFTTDESGVIEERLFAYRSVIQIVLQNVEKAIEEELFRQFRRRRPGLLVICDEDGSFRKSISLPPIIEGGV